MDNRDVNPSQGFGATDRQLAWGNEEAYWRDNWIARPYATADRDFDYYRPAYRFGFDAAHRDRSHHWDDIQNDLRADWETYEHRGTNTWDNIKDAVRDAWNRVANR